MNLNTLAKKICAKEGGKVNLPIAQVKEVMNLVLDELARADMIDLLLTLDKHSKKKKY